jgi:hypothetical protein
MSGQLLRLCAAAVISPGGGGGGVVPVGARLSFTCSAANKQVNYPGMAGPGNNPVQGFRT